MPSKADEVRAGFNADKTRRYWLTCDWDRTANRLVFVMLNPSIAGSGATRDNLDPTLRRCRAFAKEGGFGGFHVVNLFSKVSTDPRGLAGEPDVPDIRERRVLLEVLRGAHGEIVCGWGAQPIARVRGPWFVAAAAAERKRLTCLGLTNGGAPRHPLYVRGDTPLKSFAQPEGAR